jgi:hypothetical protein
MNNYNMSTFSLKELQERHRDNFAPKRVVSLETAQMEAETRSQIQGNQFQQEEPSGLLGFSRKAFDTIFGGVKLAEGLGKGLAAPSVQSVMSEAERMAQDVELNLIKTIRQSKEAGKDTTRLEKALAMQRENIKVIRDAQEDFVESLPSNKEVVGSALRLGTAAVAPTTGKTMVGVTGAGSAVGVGQGMLRGGLAGAGTGVATGALSGAGMGLEQNKDLGGVAMSSLGGAAIGGASGGVLGAATGSFVGKANAKIDPDTIIKNVTPDPAQLTPKQYKEALARGQITPKTATTPAQYKMSGAEKNVALKYANVIDKDPVKTTLNINNTIADLDDEVGTFLRQNNGIFTKGELRNQLTLSLKDLTDITVDQKSLAKAKQNLINNFIDDLDTKDMESLWEARKAFDQQIDKAFTGSPTLQKQLKVQFRNAVQDFISQRTPDDVYSSYMKDMSNLFRLRDNVLLKASKERAESGIKSWIKANPLKAQAVGAVITGVTVYGLSQTGRSDGN